MITRNTFTAFVFATILSCVAISCTQDGELIPYSQDHTEQTTHLQSTGTPTFTATLTDAQKENLARTGNVFLPSQEKNSWENVISGEVPSRWGLFDLPEVGVATNDLRAVGVWGSYPGRYWTMIRVKTGWLDSRTRDALNLAVREIENETNVRFYNSQLDPEYDQTYGIKLPNVYVRSVQKSYCVSGSFGMSGGEQYIDVPSGFSGTDEELKAYIMHALCNAAGMFNEVQRNDRDEYVDINWSNIPSEYHWYFNKVGKNYTQRGYFDYNSITMPHSQDYSKNGRDTFLKKGGARIAKNIELSRIDKLFLNEFYLPYIARTDLYVELDDVVYYQGRVLTGAERLELQRSMNESRGLYGEPPIENRIERQPW